jgi:periplasmic divalent cation tolerance protein
VTADLEHVAIMVTVNSAEQAPRIAGILLKRRRAACANVVSGVHSHYWRNGAINTAEEATLIIKTRAALVDEVVDLVRRNHPADVAEVIALPIVGGIPEYLA